MTEKIVTPSLAEDTKGLEPLKDAPIAPAHGIAAVALNMSLKYHDIATVQDGTLYQQYKMEGRNMRDLHLNDIFETAIKMEAHLIHASDRIAELLIDAIAVEVEDDGKNDDRTDPSTTPQEPETK